MKKWIWISIGIFILVLWQAISIYVTVQADKNDGIEKYRQAIPTTYIVEETYRYHGEERYMVFKVMDENEEQAYFYVSEEGETLTLADEDIQLSLEEAKSKAQQEFTEIESIVRVTPAYSSHDFTWEIVALDTMNQYQYLYYSMTKGTFQKRLTLSS